MAIGTYWPSDQWMIYKTNLAEVHNPKQELDRALPTKEENIHASVFVH